MNRITRKQFTDYAIFIGENADQNKTLSLDALAWKIEERFGVKICASTARDLREYHEWPPLRQKRAAPALPELQELKEAVAELDTVLENTRARLRELERSFNGQKDDRLHDRLTHLETQLGITGLPYPSCEISR